LGKPDRVNKLLVRLITLYGRVSTCRHVDQRERYINVQELKMRRESKPTATSTVRRTDYFLKQLRTVCKKAMPSMWFWLINLHGSVHQLQSTAMWSHVLVPESRLGEKQGACSSCDRDMRRNTSSAASGQEESTCVQRRGCADEVCTPTWVAKLVRSSPIVQA
jgi:hypothetical protein